MKLNYAMLARVIGWLLLIEAGFMCIPILTALIAGEKGAMMAFGFPALLTAAVGGAFTRFIKPSRTDLGKRESLLLTALVWIVFSLFGMLPFILAPSARLTVSEAFFEAMSGFTTTGATMIADTDALSHAINVWHCLCQWIGGLGIIIFTLAVIPMFNTSGGIQMFSAESTGITVDKISPRISSTAKGMWIIYLVLTLILFSLLWLGPMDCFQAACHAMATMSTGGFSTSASGINCWCAEGIYVKIVLTVFMFIGGVNFALIHKALMRPFSVVKANDSLKTFCRAIIMATILTTICIISRGAYRGWESLTIDPLFQVVSCITSTGYSLESFPSWGPAALAIAMMLMFAGGCAGSTSGGAKIDRLVYLGKYLENQMRHILRPNSVHAVIVNHRVVPSTTINKVVSFICIYVIVMVIGATMLALMGVPIITSFYCSFAAITNAGFESMTHSFTTIPQAGLWILSAVMLIGRLEIFTILVIFTHDFWHR